MAHFAEVDVETALSQHPCTAVMVLVTFLVAPAPVDAERAPRVPMKAVSNVF